MDGQVSQEANYAIVELKRDASPSIEIPAR